jgi:hypothetical protein
VEEMMQMSKAEVAAAFNEWLRQYTNDPEAFKHTVSVLKEFLADLSGGREPGYGDQCIAFLEACHAGLQQTTKPRPPPNRDTTDGKTRVI